VLGPDLIGQRAGLGPRVCLECVEPDLHVLAQLAGLLDDPLFEPREPAIQLAQLIAEQQIADLVDAGAAGGIHRRRTSATFLANVARLVRHRALIVVVRSHGIVLGTGVSDVRGHPAAARRSHKDRVRAHHRARCTTTLRTHHRAPD
jgi:hypothetical protein